MVLDWACLCNNMIKTGYWLMLLKAFLTEETLVGLYGFSCIKNPYNGYLIFGRNWSDAGQSSFKE